MMYYFRIYGSEAAFAWHYQDTALLGKLVNAGGQAQKARAGTIERNHLEI
jgi:hypothetical protein